VPNGDVAVSAGARLGPGRPFGHLYSGKWKPCLEGLKKLYSAQSSTTLLAFSRWLRRRPNQPPLRLSLHRRRKARRGRWWADHLLLLLAGNGHCHVNGSGNTAASLQLHLHATLLDLGCPRIVCRPFKKEKESKKSERDKTSGSLAHTHCPRRACMSIATTPAGHPRPSTIATVS